MMKQILCLFLMMPFVSFSQDSAIRFEKGLTWEQVQQKAKNENKFIFMDCYATWCKPCKQMEQEIFSQKEVGAFFNDKFVNVKVQMDSLSIDNNDVKEWYSVSRTIRNKYKINAYPTYLFFNSSGELAQIEVGAHLQIKEWLLRANNALDSNEQFYAMLKKYNLGQNDEQFIKKFTKQTLKYQQLASVNGLSDRFLSATPDMYTKEDIELLTSITTANSKDAFNFFQLNSEHINQVMEKPHFAEDVLIKVLYVRMSTKYFQGQVKKIKWSKIEKEIRHISPNIADELVMKMKADRAYADKNWELWGKQLLEYYDKYPASQNLFWMNNVLWNVFERCKDKNTLLRAAEWSQKGFRWRQDQSEDDPVVVDTYANLLYKAGEKQKAINEEERMIAIATTQNNKRMIKEGNENLQLMHKSEPTWPDK